MISEITRKKMSDAHKGEKNPFYGKHHSEETLNKIKETKLKSGNTSKGEKNPFYGKRHSEESRKKISDKHKGLKHSEESRRKIREGNLGKKRTEDYGKRLSERQRGEKNHRFGKPVSEATRKKLSDANKGEKNPFFGKHHSETTIEKIRNAKSHPPEATRKKMSEAQKGKKRSEAVCKNLSIVMKGEKNPFFGKKHTEQTRKYLSERQKGEKNHLWKGGISYGKYCPKFDSKFKEGVRKIYNYTCVICGHVWQMGEKKHAVHHVYYNKKACCEVTEDGQYIHTLPKGEKVFVKGNPNKFVILCHRKCHSKTNSNRLYWALRFEKLINEEYGGISYIPQDRENNGGLPNENDH
jgi:hypothetical protein